MAYRSEVTHTYFGNRIIKSKVEKVFIVEEKLGIFSRANVPSKLTYTTVRVLVRIAVNSEIV